MLATLNLVFHFYHVHNLRMAFYRYNITTGTFTVPPGGDEHYFFSIYLLIDEGLYGYFDIRIYALELLCTAATEQQELPIDDGQAGCNGVAYAKEGTNTVHI